MVEEKKVVKKVKKEKRIDGTVLWMNYALSYGFIDGGGESFFMHVTETPQDIELEEGDKVSFIPAESKNGTSRVATKIKKIE